MYNFCFFLSADGMEINSTIARTAYDIGDSIENLANFLHKLSCNNDVFNWFDKDGGFHNLDMDEVSYFRIEKMD